MLKRLTQSAFVALAGFGLLACLSNGVAAQPPGHEPAPILNKFEKLLGNWRGEGKFWMAPTSDPLPWTSKHTFRRILGGHAIQEDMRIDLGPGIPGALVYRTLYSYDANQERILQANLSNEGRLQLPESTHWIDENTLVVMKIGERDGAPLFERTVYRIDADKIDLKIELVSADQPLTTIVEGIYRRSEEGYSLSDEELSQAFMAKPASDAMNRVGKMSGSYLMKGTYRPQAGAPAMEISGRDTIRPIFGGHLLWMKAVGDPHPQDPNQFIYLGISCLGWDSESNCYREFYVNNLGETNLQSFRFVDDRCLVTTSALVQQGKPAVTRGAIWLDPKGQIEKITIDRMNAADEADRAFTGEYRQAPKGNKGKSAQF